jgi:DNA-binding transcriptional MerR regulator
MIIDSVDARRAAQICGFESVAMLDYLQRTGVFVPAERKRRRRGKGRRYEFRDLLVLKTISQLLKNGASVSALRNSLQEFQKKKWKADKGSLQDDLGEGLKYFVASVSGIYFAKSADSLFDLTQKGQMVFSFVIDLDKLHSELCFEISQHELPFSKSAPA